MYIFTARVEGTALGDSVLLLLLLCCCVACTRIYSLSNLQFIDDGETARGTSKDVGNSRQPLACAVR